MKHIEVFYSTRGSHTYSYYEEKKFGRIFHIIDDIEFECINGYLYYENKPLGALKYGHPALVAALGTDYASHEAFSNSLKKNMKT